MFITLIKNSALSTLLFLAMTVVLCACGKHAKPSPANVTDSNNPVIGVESVVLCDDPELKVEKCVLNAGMALRIDATQGPIIKVTANNEQTGWLRRGAVCSESEFKRRRAANEVPLSLIALVLNDKRSWTVPSGTQLYVSRDGSLAFNERDAVWFASSEKGRTEVFGGIEMDCDATALNIRKGKYEVAKLPVWEPLNTNAAAAIPIAVPKPKQIATREKPTPPIPSVVEASVPTNHVEANTADGPVVGALSVKLFSNLNLDEKTTILALGTGLTIESDQNDVLKVKAKTGAVGWLPRCAICSASELARRRREDQVPRNIIRLLYKEPEGWMVAPWVTFSMSITHEASQRLSESFTTLSGSISVKETPFMVGKDGGSSVGIAAHEGVWFDSSAKGKKDSFGGIPFDCDPDVLFFHAGNKQMHMLPVWGSSIRPGRVPGPEQDIEVLYPLVLQGIMYRTSNLSAIVNGTKVRVGDVIQGHRVISIERNKVTFETQRGKTRVITMK